MSESHAPAASTTTGAEGRRRHRNRGPRKPKAKPSEGGEASSSAPVNASAEPSGSSEPSQNASRRRNRNRPPRNPARNAGPAEPTAPSPHGTLNSVNGSAPSVTPQAPHSGHQRSSESPRERRGRGGRGGERKRQPQGETQNAPTQNYPRSRNFGSQLTTAGPADAEAATYSPGQVVELSSRPGSSASHHGSEKGRKGRNRRGTRGRGGHRHAPGRSGVVSDTPFGQAEESLGPEDIMTRIHREIDSGDYECMVCYNSVTRRSKVWYCRCCWVVYHLNCVQKWAKQALDTPTNRPVGAAGEQRKWRCPACNNSEEAVPEHYTCWCEKETRPEDSRYSPPHSCGQTCGKSRTVPKDCPHPCDMQCHAGPCPPCTAIGQSQPCYCGREESQRRCVDTDYANGWSCGEVCGDLMPCGDHTCQQPCHPGLCGVCEVTELLQCYCGNEMKDIRCCDKDEPKASEIAGDDGDVDQWDGYYSCGKLCERKYDCGEHSCKKLCHTQEAQPTHCPLSPDVVTHCPCGKTTLNDILPEPRTKCTDPIPTCEKQCGKRLKCGHRCQQKCHEGDCRICLESVEVACCCGKTVSTTLCHQGDNYEPPMCMRNCRVALNCGRHECGAKCCSGEQKAQERLKAKKKMRPFSSTPGLQTDDGFEPEHICTRPCGRPLKCGQHNCPMLCHRGPCGTCLEASFEELACNCGRTIIQPPVPCGSKPPACRFPCTREQACGHPPVPHDCHPDDEPCPKCPYLTEKHCTCGKKTVKAVPCFRDAVSCGTRCGKKLSCGSHVCQKICHSGRCEEPCKQECGKPRNICGHPCQVPCHAPFQCSEDKPCTVKVTLQCACGGIKQEVKCGSTKTNPEGNKKEVQCNDACRSRRMALALQLDPEREAEPPYSDETMKIYQHLENKWCAAIEEKLRNFANNPTSQRIQFQPMRKPLREFIHSLATDYGFESESQDPEPYRAVRVKKPAGFTYSPKKPLAEYHASRPIGYLNTPSSGLQQLKKPRGQAVNAFLLSGIRVGLLAAELEKDLAPCLSESQLRFSLGWHGDEDVLLTPKASSLAIDQIESELRNVAPKLKRLIATKNLADSVDLCWVGQDGRIANREGERWSVVNNKKAAAPMSLSNTVQATRNRFDMTPLPKPKVEKKEKKKEKEVVDNWEMEAEEDEAAEMAKTASETASENGDKPGESSAAAGGPAEEDWVKVEKSASDAEDAGSEAKLGTSAIHSTTESKGSPVSSEEFYETVEQPLSAIATPAEEAV